MSLFEDSRNVPSPQSQRRSTLDSTTGSILTLNDVGTDTLRIVLEILSGILIREQNLCVELFHVAAAPIPSIPTIVINGSNPNTNSNNITSQPGSIGSISLGVRGNEAKSAISGLSKRRESIKDVKLRGRIG